MKNKLSKRVMWLKEKKANILTAVIILSLVITISYAALVLIPLALNQAAWALSGNYSKSLNDPLDSAVWNNLDNDFLAKSGGTMSGPLNMAGYALTNLGAPADSADAVTKQFIDSLTTQIGTIKDSSGNDLKVYCGRTAPGATNWLAYLPDAVYVDVNTSAAGFSAVPLYFSSLGGTANHSEVSGAGSIYFPTASGFRIYIKKWPDGSTLTPAQARTDYGWHIVWCAYGR